MSGCGCAVLGIPWQSVSRVSSSIGTGVHGTQLHQSMCVCAPQPMPRPPVRSVGPGGREATEGGKEGRDGMGLGHSLKHIEAYRKFTDHLCLKTDGTRGAV